MGLECTHQGEEHCLDHCSQESYETYNECCGHKGELMRTNPHGWWLN